MLNLKKNFSTVVSEDFIEKQDTESLTNYLLECYADDCNGMSDDELLIHYITQEMVFLMLHPTSFLLSLMLKR